ncbi:hypothetical protein EON67_00445 [archaeon]|nr:MAG: hypothetical protein EON67_00445 [archaeon]
MDPLTALRSAITGGRESSILLQPDGTLLIDGVAYPATAETAFRINHGARGYKLLALWLQYVHRDKRYEEYVRAGAAHGLAVVDLVIVVEKRVVLEYLKGISMARGHVDLAALTAAAAAAAGSSTAGEAGKEVCVRVCVCLQAHTLLHALTRVDERAPQPTHARPPPLFAGIHDWPRFGRIRCGQRVWRRGRNGGHGCAGGSAGA